jgi:hypothetical protein
LFFFSREEARIDWLVSANSDRGKKFYSRIGATIFEKGRLVRLSEARIHEIHNLTSLVHISGEQT